MIARILTLAMAFMLIGTSAWAFNDWESRPLTDAERAIVLEKLDGYSGDDQDFVIGRMEGTIKKENVGGGKSVAENSSIMAFGAMTPRGKHLHSVIVEMEMMIGRPCPEGQVRVEYACHWDRETTLTATEKFYNFYYLGCGKPGRTYGRCE